MLSLPGSSHRSRVFFETSMPTNDSSCFSFIANTHPCKNSGLLAQATVRVVSEIRCDAPRFPSGLMSPGANELPRRNQNRSVDLWTIRLWRTGALAVDNDETVIHRAPLCPQAPQTIIFNPDYPLAF